MDTLSRLLAIYPSHSTLDLRCHLHAPWALEHEAAQTGTAPYHLIVSGGAVLEMAGRPRQTLMAGDIVMFPSGAPHRLHAGSASQRPLPIYELPTAQGIGVKRTDGDGENTDILCGQFEFQLGARNALLAALPEVVLVRTRERADCADLRILIAIIRQEAEIEQPGATAMVSQLSAVLFTLLMRAWMEQADYVPGLFALLADRRLQPALQGMLAHPERDWQLTDMAQACHMSRATFARLFSKTAGTTPAAMLLEIRMTHTAALLRRDTSSIAAIGEAVGYQSEAAFNRAFKKYLGSSPGAYRRAYNLTVIAPTKNVPLSRTKSHNSSINGPLRKVLSPAKPLQSTAIVKLRRSGGLSR